MDWALYVESQCLWYIKTISRGSKKDGTGFSSILSAHTKKPGKTIMSL